MMSMTRSLRPRTKRKPEQTYNEEDDDLKDVEEPKAKEAKQELHIIRNRGNGCKTKITPTKAALTAEKQNAADKKKNIVEKKQNAEEKMEQNAEEKMEQNTEEKKEQIEGLIKGKEDGKTGEGEDGTGKEGEYMSKPSTPPSVSASDQSPPGPPNAAAVEKPKLKPKKKEPEGPPLSVEEEKLLQTDILTLLKRFTPKYYVPLQKTWSIPKSQLTANQTQKN